MKLVRMGTRGSALARAQSGQFAALLEQVADCKVETVLIRTEGDRVQDRPLAEVGGKGLFVREIERALQDHEIDFAVHSLKDLPYALPDGLTLTIYPQRATPLDLLIGNNKNPKQIGTGSPRRVLQLARQYPEAKFLPIRGNIDTRLHKLADPEQQLDTIVLAAAGFTRLEIDSTATQHALTIDACLPSACQGILGIECRTGDEIEALLAPLDDKTTRIAAISERTVLAALEADCTLPVAAHMAKDAAGWILRTGLWSGNIAEDGSVSELREVRHKTEHPPELTPTEAMEIATAHVEHLLAAGGKEILARHAG